jgi:hypothetical protein
MAAIDFMKPELIKISLDVKNDSLTGKVFRNCLNPRKKGTRQKVTVYIDSELLQQYEKEHPRRGDGSFGGQLSDDCNKSLVVWLQVHGLV